MQDWIYLTQLFLLCVIAVVAYALWRMFWRMYPMMIGSSPWLPTDHARLETMITLAAIRPTDRVVDLGSGDGIIVFAAALAGAKESVGYELDPFWVRDCQKKAERKGIANARFEQKDFCNVDLSGFDVVFLYQINPVMQRLEIKLQRELPAGARIISNRFTFEHWKPSHTDGAVSLYIKEA